MDWGREQLLRLTCLFADQTTNVSKPMNDFPPRQKPASFSVDEVMKKLESAKD